jgi:hypothetical protein
MHTRTLQARVAEHHSSEAVRLPQAHEHKQRVIIIKCGRVQMSVRQGWGQRIRS